jgi:hypothetical protein
VPGVLMCQGQNSRQFDIKLLKISANSVLGDVKTPGQIEPDSEMLFQLKTSRILAWRLCLLTGCLPISQGHP